MDLGDQSRSNPLVLARAQRVTLHHTISWRGALPNVPCLRAWSGWWPVVTRYRGSPSGGRGARARTGHDLAAPDVPGAAWLRVDGWLGGILWVLRVGGSPAMTPCGPLPRPGVSGRRPWRPSRGPGQARTTRDQGLKGPAPSTLTYQQTQHHRRRFRPRACTPDTRRRTPLPKRERTHNGEGAPTGNGPVGPGPGHQHRASAKSRTNPPRPRACGHDGRWPLLRWRAEYSRAGRPARVVRVRAIGPVYPRMRTSVRIC